MANTFAVDAVFRAVDRMTQPITRIQQRVSRFTRDLDRGLNGVNERVNRMIGGLGKGAMAVGALGAAGLGLAFIADELTEADVMAQKLSRSVGINIETVDALTAAIAPAGFEFETVIDLVEELNNKMGESAGIEEIGGVTDSLQILGLAYKDIAKLSPEKQFNAVMNAALGMADAQAAASAVDILMGGDANKMLGLLREKGATIEDITAKYSEMSFRSEESRAGAEKLQASFAMIKGLISNVASELAGLAGNALGPVTDRMREWVVANRDLIDQGITDTFTGMVDSVTWLVDNFAEIVVWTKRIGIGLGVFIAFTLILKTFVLVMTAVNLVMAANPFTLMVLGIIALIAVVALMIFYWEDVSRVFREAGGWVDYVIAAIALMTGPIGWLVGAAMFIYRHWDVIGPLFFALWAWLVSIFEGGVAAIKSLADSFMGAWAAVGDFFSNLWGGIKSTFAGAVSYIADKLAWITNKATALMDLGSKVTRFFGGSGSATSSPRAPQMVSPQSRTAAANSNTSRAEVTIRDTTGRATVSKGKLPKGINLARSGGL